VDDAPPLVRQDHEDEQDLAQHGGHDEEVHGDEVPRWLSRKVRQVRDGGRRWRTTYLETAACEISTPSF
jgi:hypothetical protein